MLLNYVFSPMAKISLQLAAGLGVSKIITDIVRNNVPIVTTAQAVTVKVGTFVLGSMLVEQSSNHIERTMTEVAQWLESHKIDTDPEK